VIGVSAAGPLGGERVSRRSAERSARHRGSPAGNGAPSGAVRELDERAAWIALAAVPGVGPAGFGAVLRSFGSARSAVVQPPERLLELLNRPDQSTVTGLRRLQRDGPISVAAELEEAARRAGGAVVTAMDPGYPAALARVDLRPPVLYVVGDLSACAPPAVAVVGTRRPSGYGRAAAVEIADELARVGVSIVSGLALGVDGAAHLAALDAGGRTVAVLPSPIDRIYPPRHRGLASRIAEEGGALVSEAPPGRTSGKPDFARRNRIISGLAEATVVIEAPDHSGALLTAASAMAQGRDLYALPGPIDAVTSRGCNRLIADHQAELVTSAISLITRLGLHPAAGKPVAVASLSESEGLVLGSLLQRSGSIEELAGRTRLGTPELASALTLLEARGLVASYGGVTFHPTLAAKRIGTRQ
jgi:DNA processing protein